MGEPILGGREGEERKKWLKLEGRKEIKGNGYVCVYKHTNF